MLAFEFSDPSASLGMTPWGAFSLHACDDMRLTVL